MLFELRFYHVAQGRMPDLHNRMREHLPPLFERHGVTVAGRWTAVAGPRLPLFVYLMPWRDWEARERAWGGFYADPEWWRVRAETNDGSEIVERYDLSFLKPGAAWPEKDAADAQDCTLHELIVQEVAPGQVGAAHDFLRGVRFPKVEAAGGRTLGVFDVVSGANTPAIATFLAWPDFTSRQRGWAEHEADAKARRQLLEAGRRIGLPLIGRADTFLLEPASYAPILPRLGRAV